MPVSAIKLRVGRVKFKYEGVLKLLFSSELILTVVDDIITENNQNEASLS